MNEVKKGQSSFDNVFYKSHKQFLIAGILFSIVGLSADSIEYFQKNIDFLFFMNLVSGGLLLFSFGGFILKKINKKVSAIILVYTMILNILITNIYFFANHSADWQYIIIRGSLIITIYISIATLLLNKVHIIVINILYAAVVLVIRYASSEPGFITGQAFLLIFIMAGFSYALYMFNRLLKVSIREKRRLNSLIFEQEKAALANKKEVAELRAKNLEDQVIFKNKELISKTLAIAQNIDFKKNLINRLKELTAKVSGDVEDELLNLLSELSASEKGFRWDEFHKRFEDVHQDFFKKILNTSPNLTPSELKLAAFIRLGLSTKEISTLTYNNVSSIEVARSRLRKKMRLKTSDNLTTYLSQV